MNNKAIPNRYRGTDIPYYIPLLYINRYVRDIKYGRDRDRNRPRNRIRLYR